jgi:hypothetical protein
MDPLSALSVAAAVVQFVDFTSGLLSSTYSIYTSKTGDTKPHADLQTITTSLENVSNALLRSLTEAETQKGGKAGSSKNDEDLARLCRECSSIADELLRALSKLRGQGNHNIWNSFCQALRTVWKQPEISALQMRLKEYREQISMIILVSVRYGSKYCLATMHAKTVSLL